MTKKRAEAYLISWKMAGGGKKKEIFACTVDMTGCLGMLGLYSATPFRSDKRNKCK